MTQSLDFEKYGHKFLEKGIGITPIHKEVARPQWGNDYMCDRLAIERPESGFAAITTEDRLQRAIELLRGASALVGVPVPDGLTVIDVDVKNGANGWDSLRQWERELFDYPRVSTKSGGTHIFVAWEDIRARAGALTGVDIRQARKSYVKAYHSTIDNNTRAAILAAALDPKPMPRSLLAAIAPPKRERDDYRPVFQSTGDNSRAINKALDILSSAAEGTRNDTLNSVAYWLHHKVGVDINCLRDTALGIGLTEREVERTFESVTR